MERNKAATTLPHGEEQQSDVDLQDLRQQCPITPKITELKALWSMNMKLEAELKEQTLNLVAYGALSDKRQMELQSQVEMLKGKLKISEETVGTSNAQVNAMTKELEEKSKTLKDAQEELFKKANQVDDCIAAIKKLNSTNLTLKSELKKQRVDLEKCRAENDLQQKGLQAEMETLKMSEETVSTTNAQENAMTKELEEDAQEELYRKAKQLSDYIPAIKKRNSTNMTLKSELKKQRVDLEKCRAENNLQQWGLQAEIKTLQGKLKHCEETKKALDAKLIGMTKELDKKSKALQDLENKELITRQRLEDVREESITLKRILETCEETKRAAAAQVKEKTQELEQKTENLEFMESLNQVLTFKELRVREELNGARKELVNGLSDELNDRTFLKIKRMGEVDQKAFRKACAQKFPHEDLPFLAAEICSEWQVHVGNPAWHPFKKVNVQGALQEIVDEDDEKLKELRNELGEVAYDAVATALVEMNEYNVSGRFVVSEIWNSKKRRRATLEEIIKYLIQQLKSHKRKRRF